MPKTISSFYALNNPKAIWCLRICTFATVIGGTFAKSSADVATGRYHNGLHGYYQFDRHFTALACVHTIASDYLRQRKLGVRPVFDPLRYPDIGRQLSPDAWDDVFAGVITTIDQLILFFC
ncbi:putative transport protein [Escherichia coli]|uniref:Putative transport protein n=1 Tax=Escherichia coli TaxID=562 RepID=A0A376L1C2_ECOLX|nr:putative transport protein [Escherichia coli]